tara:strand:+ start:40014 stop:40217 length:204 start_codon:yes stop_codon:yes gene_type:complete
MKKIYSAILMALIMASCSDKVTKEEKKELADNGTTSVETAIGPLELVSPYTSKSVSNNRLLLNGQKV